MKRPMGLLAVSWLAGIILASRKPDFEAIIILFLYFILIIIGLLILKKYPRILNSHMQTEWYPQFTLLLFLIPCLFISGFWRMNDYADDRRLWEQPWQLLMEEGESYVTVEGVVTAKKAEESILLELTDCEIIGYYGQENQSAGDCRVRVEEEGKEWLPETMIGNRIRVFGKFSIFQPAGNPGQFDAYDNYSKKGLFADVSALRITILENTKDRERYSLFIIKQRLRQSIASLYPEEKAGVLTAMLLGDKDLLPEEIEILYRQNGISHILAISGLHISMLCMGLFRFLRKLTVPLRLSAAISVLFLLFYVVFTGASTSSVRAAVMSLVTFGALLLRRSYDLFSSLSFAAIIVTAVWPAEITSAGFLLSFGAVFGVALAQETEYVVLKSHEGKRPWWCVMLYGGMIQVITLPVALWFFYELAPYGILLNLLVIPLVSLIIGGGLLSAVLGIWWGIPARLPVGGTYLLLEFYEWLCKITQKLPFSVVLLGRPAVWQVLVYYSLLLIAFIMFFHNAKNVAKQEKILFAGLIMAVGILFLPAGRNTEILFLDVSQGDSALITTTEGKVILSDCGSSDVSKIGQYRVSPVLKQKGIMLVDTAVVSHLDSDHTSGIKEILEAMPIYEDNISYLAEYEGAVGIKELVLPKVVDKSEAYTELENLAFVKQVPVRYLQAGETLYQEEELLIECVYPREAKESENDTSLVFLLQTPKLLVWLMGDAGIAPEADIMSRLAAVNMDTLSKGKTVLLKAGHHGSKTSSGTEFLNFVKPDIAVISCGYHNSYGHPHKEVVERFLASGAEVLRTDLQGAIVVEYSFFGELRVYGWRKRVRE